MRSAVLCADAGGATARTARKAAMEWGNFKASSAVVDEEEEPGAAVPGGAA